MNQPQADNRQRRFVPSLEGVRGYGFLFIFLAHYFGIAESKVHGTWWLYPLFLIGEISWIMVPAFFVLSGYLICGILYATRDREGYFKIFYSRRILRILPLYYLTLLAVGCVDSLRGLTLGTQFWSHFLCIQNLLPGYRGGRPWVSSTQIIHLWSIAVEEQFYLLWPLVIWACRGRRTLLRVTCLLIGLCCALRVAAPWIHINRLVIYSWTPTRVDAILLGAVIAIIGHDKIYERIEPFAKYVALAGIGGLMFVAAKTGTGLPTGYLRSAIMIPVGNLTAAAIIVAVKQEGSLLCRICSLKWACWLGGRSYSMYLFHFTYLSWFLAVVYPALARYMPHSCALVITSGIALTLTLALGDLSFRFVEVPAFHLKSRLKYGPEKKHEGASRAGISILAKGDSSAAA
jgi:peptidoglycan/LPS O-acetylase OafA/YrhL